VKCNSCGSIWEIDANKSASLTVCPFCQEKIIAEKPSGWQYFDNTKELLAYVAAAYGNDALFSRKFFSDHTAPFMPQKQKNLVKQALECGAVKILQDNISSDRQHKEIAVNQAIGKLIDICSITREAAERVVWEFTNAISWGMSEPLGGTKTQVDGGNDNSQSLPLKPSGSYPVFRPWMYSLFCLIVIGSVGGFLAGMICNFNLFSYHLSVGSLLKQQLLVSAGFFAGGVLSWVPLLLLRKFLKTKHMLSTNVSKRRIIRGLSFLVAGVFVMLLTFDLLSGDIKDFFGHYYSNKNDYGIASYWYNRSALQGNMAAQGHLGQCYYYGHGVENDYEKAVYWLAKSAERGYFYAQYYLGQCYLYGRGVKKDTEKGVHWLAKSGEQGFTYAQFELGLLYFIGQNDSEKDYKKAVYWFTKSAEQGHYSAQNLLGQCYYNGWGVEKDTEKAKVWFTKAADQGVDAAQLILTEIEN